MSSAVAKIEWQETQSAAAELGIELHPISVEDQGDLDSALGAVAERPAEGLLVIPDTLFNAHVQQLVTLAAVHRLPAMYGSRAYVLAGGLMAYSVDRPAMYRRAAYYVDRILKGARPGELPIEQASRFEFVVNMRTAEALGITFPQGFLAQATDLIH
jgi:putative ABC transport system substrate-binding protein